MKNQDWEDAASLNVELHLGDLIEEGMSPDEIYEEAYTLAFDALADKDVDIITAGQIATKVAKRFTP